MLSITPSVGIAVWPHDGLDADTLLRNADAAMYHAKESGRNTYRFFTEEMSLRVRERLDLLWLPVEATRPLLLRFDPSSEPVMRVAFVDETARAAGGEDRLKFLRRFADDRIKPEIESVEGSAAVKVSGGFEDEVQIYVDQQRLAQLRLSIEQVAERIGAENVNLSGGRLEQGTQRFLVRTVN